MKILKVQGFDPGRFEEFLKEVCMIIVFDKLYPCSFLYFQMRLGNNSILDLHI